MFSSSMPTSGHARRIVHMLIPWISILVLVIVWFAVTNTRSSPGFFPSPQQVIGAAGDLASEGLLWNSIGISLARVVAGVLTGVIVAVPAALFSGATRAGYVILDKPAHMLRAIPFNAISPLLIIAIGIGEGMKITLIAIGVFGPLYVNLRDGVRSLDPKLLEFAQAYRLKRRTVFTQILLRGTLPSFMTGLRFGLTVAWIALVTCETVNSQNGLGYILARSQQFSRTDQMVLCIVIYAVLGLASEALVGVLERLALPWKQRAN